MEGVKRVTHHRESMPAGIKRHPSEGVAKDSIIFEKGSGGISTLGGLPGKILKNGSVSRKKFTLSSPKS